MAAKIWEFVKWQILEPYINLPIFTDRYTLECDICFAGRLIAFHTALGMLIGYVL